MKGTIDLVKAKEIIENDKRIACQYLDISPENTFIKYVDDITKPLDFPIYFSETSYELSISLSRFNGMMDSDDLMKYRLLVYQGIKYISLCLSPAKSSVADLKTESLAFAYASLMIQGNVLPYQDIRNFSKMVEKEAKLISNLEYKCTLDQLGAVERGYPVYILNREDSKKVIVSVRDNKDTSHPECFRNFYEAWRYVFSVEKESYQKDEMRQRPPLVVGVTAFNYPEPPDPIRVNDLDYPFSAFFNDASYDKFIPTRLESGRYSFKPNLRSRKFLFRGQSEFHDPSVPNIYRAQKEEKLNYLIGECALGQELMLLMLSHPLVQLFDIGFSFANRHFRAEMNLFGLTQHYYNKTSMLDFTSDPRVSAFFAVTDYDRTTDTYSPVTNDGREGVLYYYDLDISTSFQASFTKDAKLSTIGLQVFPRSGNQKGFLLEMSKGCNLNSDPNVRYVKFRHNAEISRRIFEQMEGGKLLFPDDILAKHWTVYNKDQKFVSRSSMILNSLMNPQQHYDSLVSAIKEYGYEIKDYKPVFTQEELAEYYLDVKNGFWEEFCNKIHIPGDDEGKLREQLLQIENNDDYKWAFKHEQSYKMNYKDGYLMSRYEKALIL